MLVLFILFTLFVSRVETELSTFPEIPSFSRNDHPVKQVSSTKSLGVHIDQNMNWPVIYRTFAKRLLLHWAQSSEYDILYP